MKLSETESAWLAGLLDGEGYVSVRKVQRGNDGYTSYQPVVSVSMTDLTTIEKLHELLPYGGSIKPRVMEGNRKVQYTWRASNTPRIEQLCDMVLPYSVTKRRQFTLLKEICHIKQKNGRGKRATDSFYIALCEQLFAMNKKGI